MRKLPLPIEIDIYRAQMEAIEALQAGVTPDAVRINMGRRLIQIRKFCREPGQWHRALKRLRLLKADAKAMIKAAKLNKLESASQIPPTPRCMGDR